VGIGVQGGERITPQVLQLLASTRHRLHARRHTTAYDFLHWKNDRICHRYLPKLNSKMPSGIRTSNCVAKEVFARLHATLPLEPPYSFPQFNRLSLEVAFSMTAAIEPWMVHLNLHPLRECHHSLARPDLAWKLSNCESHWHLHRSDYISAATPI
jgi:hypothetical protein